jgi:hypothetical protein
MAWATDGIIISFPRGDMAERSAPHPGYVRGYQGRARGADNFFRPCCILKSATCSQMLARSVIWGPVKLTTVFSSHAMATYRYMTARGLRGREELVQLLHLHRSTCPICVPNSQFPSCSLSLGLPEISSRQIRMSFVPSPIRDIRARHYLTRSATCGSP